MGNNIKVSIILPVYNAGARIYKCLDTLVNQTLKDIEIICILDCPTDGSDLVVKEYAQKDDRIKIIENRQSLHIGNSRNAGLAIAQGEYIGFSDHDDYRELDMYECLYRQARKEDADICMSNQCSVTDGALQVFAFPSQTVTDAKAVFQTLLSNKPMSHRHATLGNIRSVWNHIFRRAFITDHHVSFPDTKVICHEDTLFCTRFFCHLPKVSYVPKNLYYWVISSAGTLQTLDYGNIFNNIRYVEALIALLKDNHLYDDYLPYLVEGMIRKLYSALHFQQQREAGDVKTMIQTQMSTFPLLHSLVHEVNLHKMRYLHRLPPTKILFFVNFLSNL